ncbi:MAG TPA: hypothetical protein VKA46_40970 [Gemmataceae bacterium]|nr:hypothetical protein [Gemmataceae bacterium]
MPSLALQEWSARRAAVLDEIEYAHRSVGGAGPGQRFLMQQINQAYALLLSSQWQGFCRDLHTDCADYLVASVASPVLREIYQDNLLFGRKLDTGNPTPGNIGADFDRLGLSFWPLVLADHAKNAHRRDVLATLNRWRNAIAHDAFAPDMYKGSRPSLRLAEVQDWRRACDGLARSFDNVRHAHLLAATGVAPW